jgi:putative SOS response-associated peptidase YedK
MCGRYAQYSPAEAIADAFGALLEIDAEDPRYNAAPMQWLPVVRQRPNGDRVVQRLRWGLMPSWSKDESIGAKLINARGETVATKASFRAAFRQRRCIVPADGFYEWATRPDGKQPYYLHAPDGSLLALAGLWERWTRPDDGESIDSFAIVTTDANAVVGTLHNRMPVILAPAGVAAWLDRETPAEVLQGLLVPCPGERLAMHPVSRAVGSVRNDDPTLIAPT